MYLKKYHIHFVGIAGVGMSGIAKLLLELGYKVSGSDVSLSSSTDSLELLGGSIFLGHNREHFRGADVVVVSSAIGHDNVEVEAARAEKISVVPRAEMLAELMKHKCSIAVAGTHGKTSTTALVADLLKAARFDPTIVVGGVLKEYDTNALMGNGDFMIAEVDESDGSLLQYSPAIAVITNIDIDHLDFYENIDEIKQMFSSFIDKMPFYGVAILCLDDNATREIIPKINKKITTYGVSSQADLLASRIIFDGMTSRFNVAYLDKEQGEITLNLPGIHNVYNALAAIAVGIRLEISFDVMKDVMKNVKGVKRRTELKGEVGGVTIIDDYAHHPTEILATLKTIAKSWSNKRRIVVFQPHRYTRTETLFDEFSNSFYQSDVLIILPIYAAGEKFSGLVKSKDLFSAIQATGHPCVFYSDNFKSCVQKLKIVLKKGDILLTMGAGNVYQVGIIMAKLLG